MKILIYISLFLISVAVAFAELPVKMDLAVFRMNDSLNICEIYYSFPDDCLSYKIDDEKKKGLIGFAIGVIENGKMIDSVQWIQEINIPDKDKDYVSVLVGIKTMLVPIGDLELKFVALDMNDRSKSMLRTVPFHSPEFDENSLSISDLQIAAIIEPEKKATQKWNKSFKKNGLYVVPNPGRDIVGKEPKLYVYFEIYNAKKDAPDGLNLTYIVRNAGQREVFTLPRKKKSFSDAFVEYIGIPVEALPTGVYYLTVEVSPSDASELVISKTKKIYVTNFEMPPKPVTEFYENKDFEQSEFATLSEEQVKTNFDQIKLILTDYETEVWEKCETNDAKKRFLFTFWASRNTDTTKPYNEALEEFRARVDYANKHFKYGLMKEGWRTPRGRVYLRYGEPTRIERFVQKGDQPAYEKWYYDEMQGGVHFVFIDFRNNGYYQLVHSTAEGEMYNDNWYEQYIERQDPGPNFEYQKSNNIIR